MDESWSKKYKSNAIILTFEGRFTGVLEFYQMLLKIWVDLYLTSVLKYNYIAFLALDTYSVLVIEMCGWVVHAHVCAHMLIY